ncbi:Mth938-like domain-containing protein [Alphaproteobacteria bacterium]|jgi:uncharacterized protein|nr:Mth938-like domain-containing protein [Alphaproteobacteria bacterium]
MDITPALAVGSQVIDGYGDGGFRVAGKRLEGAIIVTPSATFPWEGGDGPLTIECLQPILDRSDTIDILLIGCGKSLEPIPVAIKNLLRENGIGADPMDTGAACRTYNVLLTEDRRVAVALRPVG